MKMDNYSYRKVVSTEKEQEKTFLKKTWYHASVNGTFESWIEYLTV